MYRLCIFYANLAVLKKSSSSPDGYRIIKYIYSFKNMYWMDYSVPEAMLLMYLINAPIRSL